MNGGEVIFSAFFLSFFKIFKLTHTIKHVLIMSIQLN